MNKIFLVAAQHVRVIAFWKPFLLALLFGPPLFVLGAMGMGSVFGGDAARAWDTLPQRLAAQMTRGATENERAGYVDDANVLRATRDEAAARNFIAFANKADAQRALVEKNIAGYYVIPSAFIATGDIVFYSEASVADLEMDARFERWVIEKLARAENPARLARIVEPLRQTRSENAITSMLGFAPPAELTRGITLAAVFLFALIFAGNLLLTPLAREREGRVLDVILGSVSPAQFLLGKYLGALTVAVMLLASWCGWSLLLARGETKFFAANEIAWGIIVFAVSGFLLYAALLTVFGAWLELYPESQRIPLFVGMFGLLPLMILLLTNAQPNEPHVVIVSLIPLFAPTVMVWRMQLTQAPFQEMAGALGALWLTTIFFLWLAVYWFRRRVETDTRSSLGRKIMWKKIADWTMAIVSGLTILYFVALRAASELTWTDVFVALVSALAVCVWIAMRASKFSTWRAFGLVLLAHSLTQAWLQWQWQLWDTSLQNVNALVALLAWDSFCALLCVSALLLIRRDASVIALAVVWLGCPLGLLVSMARYDNIAQFDALPFRESSVLLSAICFLGFLAVGGILAFGAHFLRLIYLELAGRT